MLRYGVDGNGRLMRPGEVYEYVGKQLRRYSVRPLALEVFNELRALEMAEKPGIAAVRAAPWLSFLILKMALQDQKVPLVGPAMPKSLLDRMRQQMWTANDLDTRSVPPVALVRSFLHTQVLFQQPASWDFIRWPALFELVPAGSTLRRHFQGVFGMPPESVMDLALVLYAELHAYKGRLPLKVLESVRAGYGAAVDQLLALVARDLAGLRRELLQNGVPARRGREELLEFPFVEEFPLIWLEDRVLAWWHPVIFAHGIDNLVHRRLSALGQEYTDPFSKVFDQYVQELAVETGRSPMLEAEYKSHMNAEASAVEAIIRADAANVLIEAKLGINPQIMMVSDHPELLFQRVRQLRDAVYQGSAVAAELVDPGGRFYDPARVENFLLVVTSRELNISNGEMLQQLFPHRALTRPSLAGEHALPLRNILFMSIKEFERFVGAVRLGQIEPGSFLRKVVADNAAPGGGRLHFSEHFNGIVARFERPARMRDAVEKAQARLVAALGPGASA